jgi:bacillithiol system protein YtxJ
MVATAGDSGKGAPEDAFGRSPQPNAREEPMTTRFAPVADAAALDALFAASEDGPVVLFKHDPVCSISANAYEELARLGSDVPLIDVEGAEDVAAEVATRTGVAHESPQVIVLRGGAAVWSASLADVTAAGVAAAVREHA